ncbi:MAG: hypothetical protein MRY83_06150 [Flavobacteriales bacterium]|nr:hypothetical protein [Flavobacteriales bacterium]
MKKPSKKALIRWKVYVDRAKMYIGYLQFMMIGFVFLKSYEDTAFGQLIFENIWISLPVIFLVCLGLFLVIGRVDTLLGLREEEMRNASNTNPVLRQISKDISKLKEQLEKG